MGINDYTAPLLYVVTFEGGYQDLLNEEKTRITLPGSLIFCAKDKTIIRRNEILVDNCDGDYKLCWEAYAENIIDPQLVWHTLEIPE